MGSDIRWYTGSALCSMNPEGRDRTHCAHATTAAMPFSPQQVVCCYCGTSGSKYHGQYAPNFLLVPTGG